MRLSFDASVKQLWPSYWYGVYGSSTGRKVNMTRFDFSTPHPKPKLVERLITRFAPVLAQRVTDLEENVRATNDYAEMIERSYGRLMTHLGVTVRTRPEVYLVDEKPKRAAKKKGGRK